MNLILLEPNEVDADGVATLTDHRATHIREVLDADTIRVGVVNGPTGTATVKDASNDEVVLKCKLGDEIPERPAVDLLLALPRPKVMKRLWAQLAALGVGRIILTNAAKVERNYFDTHVLEPETYHPLLIEGLQQARDTRLPEVNIHRRFKVLVEDFLDVAFHKGNRLLADPSGSQTIAQALKTRSKERVLLAVGPEGGWTEYELSLLKDHRFQPVSMGERTLRTDTACIGLLCRDA